MSRSCGATPSGNTTYSRDAQGNNKGTSTGPIAYNANNQVSSITNPSGAGGAVAMSYFDQGNNLRAAEGANTLTGGTKLGVTSRRSSAGITYYTRDPNGQLINTRGRAAPTTTCLTASAASPPSSTPAVEKPGPTPTTPTARPRLSREAAAPPPRTVLGATPVATRTPPTAITTSAPATTTSPATSTRPIPSRGALPTGEVQQLRSTAGDPINNTDPSGTVSGADFGGAVGGFVGESSGGRSGPTGRRGLRSSDRRDGARRCLLCGRNPDRQSLLYRSGCLLWNAVGRRIGRRGSGTTSS